MNKKITIKKALEIAKHNRKQYVNVDELAHELGLEHIINDYNIDINDDVLYSRYFYSWICTDTLVGYAVMYLYDKPVAVSSQFGRKSTVEYYWFGVEGARAVQKYLFSLIKLPEVDGDYLNAIDENTTVFIEEDA